MAPNRNIWREWASRYTRLPYVKTFGPNEVTFPADWSVLNAETLERYVILESGKDGRFTFVAVEPKEWIVVDGDHTKIIKKPSDSTTEARAQSNLKSNSNIEEISLGHSIQPINILREWIGTDSVPPRDRAEMKEWMDEVDVPFLGGMIGYISYDVARQLERLPETANDDLNMANIIAMRVDQLWIWDHENERLTCAVHLENEWMSSDITNPQVNEQIDQAFDLAERLCVEMFDRWCKWSQLTDEQFSRDQQKRSEIASWQASNAWDIHVDQWTHLQRSFDSAGFQQAVRRIQEWIRAGDVFQVNLSVRQSCKLKAAAEEVYRWLRLLNPSPYMSYFHWPQFQLVSGSPELLVKIRGRKAVTRPIAGTRPRGKTPQDDRRYADELLNNEKERAEHVMLVDLERNDLGRVCQYGTVRVSELLTIERYSHVMHLVSQVEGQLADDKDAFDLLAASFPGGTITGAPKIRTMEIIETLEPVRRGPYTGSLGWIDYGGDMEMNILIRTMLCKDGQAYIQAGAGIVIDSIPEKEYQESLNKAKALWKALVCAERTEVEKR